MSAKMAAARQAAFLKALGETGNFTLSAEKAKLSLSWVRLHRAEDQAFDAACRTAVAAAKARLARAGDNRPPRGWGHLDGAELVVRGTGGSGGGRRVQIARARPHQWTPRVEDRFLAVLGATCNVKAAYREAGMSKGSAYSQRARWPGFARRWQAEEAVGSKRLQFALARHAANLFSGRDLPPAMPVPPMSVDGVRILAGPELF